MYLALRFVVYLIGMSVPIGPLYGAAVLGFDDNEYALYTFKYVYPFVDIVAFGLAFVHSRPVE